MKFKDLLDVISEDYDVSHSTLGNCPNDISDLRLIGKTNKWDPDVLYVGEWSQVESLPTFPVMTLTWDKPYNISVEGCHGYIKRDDLVGVFNLSKDLIFDSLKSERALLQLMRDLTEEKSILSAINTAARLLGNALILADASMNVLAYSTVYDIADPLWAENIKRGRYSYEFIKKVQSSKEMRDWQKSGKETQTITLPGDNQPKLVARITQDGHIKGGIVMIAHHKPIDKSHYHQLPIVGKMLMDAFIRETSGTTENSVASTILYNLLDEEKISETMDLDDMGDVSFPAEMMVVVARFIKPVENRYLKRTISVELERIFPEGFSVQYKNYMAILVPSVSLEQEEALQRLIDSEDIAIGVSWKFDDVSDFKIYFNQAVSSIKQAHLFSKEEAVLYYTDYSFYNLLYNYTGRIPLSQYCNPALGRLRDYDRENGTEFYDTLKVYLDNNRNIKETSNSLFIHRNSLIYRISRISEIIGMDLNDSGNLHSLMDSIRIRQFLDSRGKGKKK
ncbi:PucR family transcriptional regulator [Gudongella sp. SC589]|uniref:PucR family transcriptional regulator n=1 Tax=Gudongella sp. SC589 TaxID=3385990 RepID=UPI003904A83F